MFDKHTHPAREQDGDYRVVNNGVPLKRISWSAVFAGVIVAMVIYLLLTILGTAIGTSTVDPLKEQNPVEGLGMGAAIWSGVSMLLSIAAGGYVSGRLAQREGALHGLLMFGVNTLVLTWLLITLTSSAVTGTMNVLGTGLQAIGSGARAIAPPVVEMAKNQLAQNNINLDNIQNELETTLRQTGKPELQPEALQNQAQGEINNAQNQAQGGAPAQSPAPGAANPAQGGGANQAGGAGSPGQTPNAGAGDLAGFFKGLIDRNAATFEAADREALKNIIQARTGKSDAEAEQIVNQTEQSYQAARAQYEQAKQQAEQKSRELAEKAAAATAKAAWFAFFMMIVEAVLAGVMGMVGRRTQPRTVTSEQRPYK